METPPLPVSPKEGLGASDECPSMIPVKTSKDLFRPDIQREHAESLIQSAVLMLEMMVGKCEDEFERAADVGGFLKKCTYQTATVWQIVNQGIDVLGLRRVSDYQSAAMLARSTIEAALLMGYLVCCFETSEDESAFRHAAWRRSGLLRRIDLVFNKAKFATEVARDQTQADELEKVIRSTAHFQALNEKQKEAALKPQWRPPTWKMMIKELELNEKWLVRADQDLSQYVHSKSTVIFKAAELSSVDEERISRSALLRSLAGLALAVQLFADYFEKPRAIFRLDADAMTIWKLYHNLIDKQQKD